MTATRVEDDVSTTLVLVCLLWRHFRAVTLLFRHCFSTLLLVECAGCAPMVLSTSGGGGGKAELIGGSSEEVEDVERKAAS